MTTRPDYATAKQIADDITRHIGAGLPGMTFGDHITDWEWTDPMFDIVHDATNGDEALSEAVFRFLVEERQKRPVTVGQLRTLLKDIPDWLPVEIQVAAVFARVTGAVFTPSKLVVIEGEEF